MDASPSAGTLVWTGIGLSQRDEKGDDEYIQTMVAGLFQQLGKDTYDVPESEDYELLHLYINVSK